MTIETVVFDIGNVLIRWDPRFLYRRLFGDEAEMEWFLANVVHHDWNLAQDAGRGWPEAIAEAIGRHPDRAAEIRAYRERWHEMIPGAIDGTVALLERLHRQGTPLYAITNWAADTFLEARRRFSFLDLFRDVVVSGVEGVVKPDPRIYRILAERAGIDFARTLYIDDSAKNVAGAEAVGMRGLLYVDPDGLAEALGRLEVLRPA